MITKQSKDNLKAQINIQDVIAEYIELKKSGANFKACCPFHGEDTPSFVVSPTKGIYHCFGCSVGGDAFKFVMDYEKLSFQEAVEKVANSYNFTLEYENNANYKDYSGLMESVNDFYERSLDEKRLEYLLKRGLTKESIKKFELGYAPRSDKQIEFLNSQFLSQEDAVECGVLVADNNRLYARQIERISFPIRNHAGKLIAWGGRTLKEGNVAKYINTSDTKLFNKSRNLYGYHLAKEHIYKKGTMVITEGYLDVIMMHQAEIQTAVATMGTALTKEHIPIIKRGDVRVLLCYDGDKAGRAAAYKASVLLSQFEIDGGVVLFSEGVDPADMVKEGRVEELYSIMKKPIPLINYALNYIVGGFDLKNPHNKNIALKECVEYLKTLNLLIAEEYKGYLAKLLNIGSHHITLGQTVIEQDVMVNKTIAGVSKADEKFFKTLIDKPEFLDLLLGRLDFEVYEHSKVFHAIMNGNLEDESLRPFLIRDDIVIYNEEDFIEACRLKQKGYLESELKKLATSSDEDVFERMDRVQRRLNSL